MENEEKTPWDEDTRYLVRVKLNKSKPYSAGRKEGGEGFTLLAHFADSRGYRPFTYIYSTLEELASAFAESFEWKVNGTYPLSTIPAPIVRGSIFSEQNINQIEEPATVDELTKFMNLYVEKRRSKDKDYSFEPTS